VPTVSVPVIRPRGLRKGAAPAGQILAPGSVGGGKTCLRGAVLASADVPARRKVERCAEETLTETGGQGSTALPDLTAPHLFVALECDRPAAGVARHSLANIDRVLVGRGSVRSSERSFDGGARTLDIRVPDPRMSSVHASLVRDGVHFAAEDLGSRNGTRVNGARIAASTPLADGDCVQVGHTILRYRPEFRVPLGEPADVDSSTEDRACPIRTIDPALARRAAALGRVARSAAPVLLLGETGTGKEVTARAIHRLSGRLGSFVPVNCGALPATLLEAQLFGHVRGAFSGAVGDAPGLLRSADGGTVLLDEIGDLPVLAQAALLRVLQEHEVMPVGGVRPIQIDLRVVAATHRPLAELVARGEFRSDLFARLAGFTFSLPPVRERREDVGLLIAAFATEQPLRFTPDAGRALLGYDWPLNVRELFQALQVAVALADGDPIDSVHLPPAIGASRSPAKGARAPAADPLYEQLVASLGRHRGNVSQVARELGRARVQVRRWMKRFGIDAGSFRRP
jgi:pSer/pThr/pTyr-binding forkhead associated (FHA) protein